MTRDLASPRLMYLKAALFLVTGLLATAIVLMEHPSLRLAGLLAVTAWSFRRAYYFAFYVIEKYIDRRFRFAGLGSIVKYWLARPEQRNN